MTVKIVTPAELDADESTPGVIRETVFETPETVMVRSRVSPETVTGWHPRGDRHVYGYVITGSGAVEYGPEEEVTAAVSAGEFFYIAPGTVHRDVNPTDEEVVVLVKFVGSGSVAVNVDAPRDELIRHEQITRTDIWYSVVLVGVNRTVDRRFS